MTQPTTAPKRVLVTGVTGQDGSYMADYLLANTDHLVYGMVRRTAKPDYGNIAGAMKSPRFKLVVGDLSDSQSIDNLVKEIRPDYLVNLAAQSFVGSSWQLPEQTIDVTGTGVARILEAVRKHAPACRTYSAGSSEQWGDVAYVPQDEKHPMRPRSPYGCAKCLASHLVKVYRESYGLYAVHAILTNHESERRGAEFVTRKISLGVARIVAAMKRGEPFEPISLGNVDAKRDWSHAQDFVEGIWLMLNQEKPLEFVLASGECHSVREFVERAFAAAGIAGAWFPGAKPEDEVFWLQGGTSQSPSTVLVRIDPAHYRPAEVDLLWGDSAAARLQLGWQPKVSFDELVRRMVASDIAAYAETQRPATTERAAA